MIFLLVPFVAISCVSVIVVSNERNLPSKNLFICSEKEFSFVYIFVTFLFPWVCFLHIELAILQQKKKRKKKNEKRFIYPKTLWMEMHFPDCARIICPQYYTTPTYIWGVWTFNSSAHQSWCVCRHLISTLQFSSKFGMKRLTSQLPGTVYKLIRNIS